MVGAGAEPNLRKILRFLTLYFVCFVFLSPQAYACTLWSVGGDHAADGGTLIAKNRDWWPDHAQKLTMVTGSGYRYLVLAAEGNDSPGAKGGVNEHGLTVITASPPSYLEKDKTLKWTVGLTRKILSKCRTVEEALALGAEFWGPQFLMLADKEEIVYVEIGLNGEYRVERSRNGTLAHTNHYLSLDMVDLNREKPGISSSKRLQAIESLLQSSGKFNFDDFMSFSYRQDQGPDNSIWRTGSRPEGVRTLATFIVSQPKGEDAVLFIRMNSPGKPMQEYRFKLRDVFAGKVDLSKVE
jgi:isopenicillin-N N-acyltransferase like protein